MAMHRTFKTIFFLVVLTSLILSVLPPMSLAENPQVTVSVYDDARVPRSSPVRRGKPRGYSDRLVST